MATTKKTAKRTAKAAKAPKPGAKTVNAAKETKPLSAADLKVTVTAVEREGWIHAAATLREDEAVLTMPIAVLLGESIDVAKFTRARWAPVIDKNTSGVLVPGLVSAVRDDLKVVPFAPTPVLHEGTAQEILVLQVLTQEAQTRALLAAKTSGGAPHPRLEGAALVTDLRGAAESYLDDGIETDEDARLRAVDDAHADDPKTDDALAGALTDYAALVETLRPGIDGYADFNPAWIDRAREVAALLRVAPAAPTPGAASDRALLDARDRLAALLLRRMRLVRAKARFVFRAHPALTREVTSAYERRRRSARKSAAKPDGASPAKPDTDG
jgi:hypothetical protein